MGCIVPTTFAMGGLWWFDIRMAADPESTRMSLGDHLDELRACLIWGLIGPLAAAVVLLIFGQSVVAWLCQPVLYALASKGLPPTLYAGAVPAAFAVYLKVSMVGGLVFGIPWLLYQLWKFIAPGLYLKERRFIYYLLPGSAALSVAGVAFMYFVLLPITLSFLIDWTLAYPMPTLEGSVIQRKIEALYDSNGPEGEPLNQPPTIWPQRWDDPVDPVDGSVWINVPQRAIKAVIDGQVMSLPMSMSRHMAAPWFTINEYISFTLWLALGCGIGFQLPMVMLALSRTGLVNWRTFAQGRKWAVLACVTVAAVLTPPDVGSQILLGSSMYLLYEFGLLLIWFPERRKEARS